MQRIMFVTGSLVHGGAERHSITLMNRLAERGHECHAVYAKNDPSQLPRIRLGPGGSVHCLQARGYFDPQAVRAFAVLLEKIRPTVIIAANGYALVMATLARRLARLDVPLAASFHTTQIFGLREHLKILLERPFFWAADKLFFVCDAQRRFWRRRALFGRSNQVIHNGVDTLHFSPATAALGQAQRSALGLASDAFVIGIAAVLRPEKNHVQLVDAIAALRAQGVAAHALMIGDGPSRAAVEARARVLQVAEFIHITGFLDDTRPCVAACDVTILCSVAVETFSLAALESMAMARPVVQSNVGGAAEMVHDGLDGFLFPARNTAALVWALACLAVRPVAERMGRAARLATETRFSEGAMVNQYELALVNLCAARQRRSDATTGRALAAGALEARGVAARSVDERGLEARPLETRALEAHALAARPPPRRAPELHGQDYPPAMTSAESTRSNAS